MLIPAVTFGSEPGAVFVPVRELAHDLNLTMAFDPVTEVTRVNGKLVSFDWPTLGDGTRLISLIELKKWGVSVKTNSKGLILQLGAKHANVELGRKRVSVSIKDHLLLAWQGHLLVMRCAVSPGRPGHPTPPGNYVTGKQEKLHISTIYGSPMPWAIHLADAIFIHGSEMFDDGVGSHGCIRLPVDRVRNWAEWFYNWAEPGIKVRVR